MKRTSGRSGGVSSAGCEACPYQMVHEVQFRKVEENLSDLRERVQRLETTLARGVMLLIANLACVIGTLAQQLLQ